MYLITYPKKCKTKLSRTTWRNWSIHKWWEILVLLSVVDRSSSQKNQQRQKKKKPAQEPFQRSEHSWEGSAPLFSSGTAESLGSQILQLPQDTGDYKVDEPHFDLSSCCLHGTEGVCSEEKWWWERPLLCNHLCSVETERLLHKWNLKKILIMGGTW